MALVQFYCDSGANIHFKRTSGWLDTIDDLALEEGDWEELSYEEKMGHVEDWANNYLDMGFEEK